MATYSIKCLSSNDTKAMRALLHVFGDAFEQTEIYCDNQPDDAYLQGLLGKDNFISLVALTSDNEVIGGLTAYELHKFEQARSEIYIYDLAVAEQYRRQGIAIALIHALKEIAAERGVYVVVVEAEHDDRPAVELYTKLGVKQKVLHFDINIEN